MWRSTAFTILTRTFVRRKNPNLLVGCFSSHLFKKIPETASTKKIEHVSELKFPVSKTEIKSPKQVLCGELAESDVNKYVALKGRLLSGEGGCWVMKDKSGVIFLHVTKNKMAELKDWVLKFKQNVKVELTGIVKRDVKNFKNPYCLLIDSVSSVQEPKVKKKVKDLLINLNEKEMSRILPVHMNWFFQRSHKFDELNEEIVGENVTLCGWVSWIYDPDKTFFMLEDGVDQILIDSSEKVTELASQIENLELNYLVLLNGEVVKRPDSEINYNLKKGTIKIHLKDIIAMDKLDQKAFDLVNCLESNEEDIDEEIAKGRNPVIPVDHNLYTLRSHNCGEINDSLKNQSVRLMGWVIFSRMNQFLVLKDKYGAVQLFLNKKMFTDLKLGLESVISVEGIVRARPENQIYRDSPSGGVEVHVKEIKVISRAKELPFTMKSFNSSKFLLLQYRYLDIRMNNKLKGSLKLRCQVLQKMRNFLIDNVGFLEVETPVLSRRSSGGAQEFIVPTRERGMFYGLVQSPQQFKQLLMIGGIDRYFQIARCFRDETSRKDRQPEFTQLDLEMSFCDQEGVLNLVEDLLRFVWPSHLPALETPFPRLTYTEAMKYYGTDKPDLRLKFKSIDLPELLEDALFKEYISAKLMNCNNLVVKGITLLIKQKHERLVTERVCIYSRNCLFFTIQENSETEFKSFFSDICGVDTQGIIRSKMNFKPGSAFILIFGNEESVENILIDLQLFYSKTCKENELLEENNTFKFVWITDFPLFEIDENNNNMKSVHHPFTQPVPEDMTFLDENPIKVRGQHYDLVLNGNEIGGGSIRIHDVSLQKKILKDILKLNMEPFKHFLRALTLGAPNHGGFALGIDRFIAILCGVSSIDDVIAFPKFHSGHDPLSGAPCEIPEEDKRLYHVESSSELPNENSN